MVHGDSNASKRVSGLQASDVLSLIRSTVFLKALSGFLSAHREVFLMFLRERPTHLFIGSIEVLQLLVVMVHRIQVNLSDADKVNLSAENLIRRAHPFVPISTPLMGFEGFKLPWKPLEPSSSPTNGSN